jgi:hypothetical protein
MAATWAGSISARNRKFQRFQAVFDTDTLVGYWKGNMIDIGGIGPNRFYRARLCRSAHGQQAAAVDPPTKGDHTSATGCRSRYFYGVLNRFCAGREQRYPRSNRASPFSRSLYSARRP